MNTHLEGKLQKVGTLKLLEENALKDNIIETRQAFY